jgi:lipopolysaccharide transport system ATP-binding protein
MSDIVIRVENISKLYRLGEVGTGSLAHDVNRWWHRVRGREDPYLKIGEVNDRTKPAKQASADGTTNHTNKHEKLNTEDTENPERGAGGNQRSDSGAGGALIALGAGFNPILTGRENIYINGSVLGLTKKELQ